MSPRATSPLEALLYSPEFFLYVKDHRGLSANQTAQTSPTLLHGIYGYLCTRRFAVNVQVSFVLDLDVVLVLRKKDFDAQSALTDVLGHC